MTIIGEGVIPLAQSRDARAIVNRLARVEGQIRGVRIMVKEGRECEDVLAQLSAAHAALEAASKAVLVHFIDECLQARTDRGEPQEETLERLTGLLSATRF